MAVRSASIVIACVIVYIALFALPEWLALVLVVPTGFTFGYYLRDTIHQVAQIIRSQRSDI
jgi:hypothetical protein